MSGFGAFGGFGSSNTNNQQQQGTGFGGFGSNTNTGGGRSHHRLPLQRANLSFLRDMLGFAAPDGGRELLEEPYLTPRLLALAHRLWPGSKHRLRQY